MEKRGETRSSDYQGRKKEGKGERRDKALAGLVSDHPRYARHDSKFGDI